jgi:hypothetical protein
VAAVAATADYRGEVTDHGRARTTRVLSIALQPAETGVMNLGVDVE